MATKHPKKNYDNSSSNLVVILIGKHNMLRKTQTKPNKLNELSIQLSF